MAWLGLIAVVGIAACGLDALLQVSGSRRDRIRRAQGRPVRSPARRLIARLVPLAVGLAVIGVVVGVGRAGS